MLTGVNIEPVHISSLDFLLQGTFNFSGSIMLSKLAGLALLGITLNATAITFHDCESCSEAQYAATALSWGLGNRYIYDIHNNVAVQYLVSREPNGHGGWQYFEDQVTPLDANLQTAFNNYRAFHISTPSDVVLVIMPPNARPDGFPQGYANGTAVDFAGTSAYSNAIESWLFGVQGTPTSQPWLPVPASLALVALQTPVNFDSAHVTVEFRIQLNDGSVVSFDINVDGVKMVKAVDKNGNTVPLKKADVGGKYVFTNTTDGSTPNGPGDINSFIQYLQQLGVPVTFNNGSRAIVCVNGSNCTTAPN